MNVIVCGQRLKSEADKNMQSVLIAVRISDTQNLGCRGWGSLLYVKWTIPRLSKLVLIFSSTFSLIRGQENKTLLHFSFHKIFKLQRKFNVEKK